VLVVFLVCGIENKEEFRKFSPVLGGYPLWQVRRTLEPLILGLASRTKPKVYPERFPALLFCGTGTGTEIHSFGKKSD
jgi:hypothetical protein